VDEASEVIVNSVVLTDGIGLPNSMRATTLLGAIDSAMVMFLELPLPT